MNSVEWWCGPTVVYIAAFEKHRCVLYLEETSGESTSKCCLRPFSDGIFLSLRMYFLLLLLGNVCIVGRSKSGAEIARYEPSWESLDARPIPKWYNEAKLGIFTHWGVYSVPAFRSEWIWYYWKGPHPDRDVENYIEKNFGSGATYAEFASKRGNYDCGKIGKKINVPLPTPVSKIVWNHRKFIAVLRSIFRRNELEN
ncbi:unnamed protein product [Enterobius vermicularis]|uniref:alpha-L-fucosidase n=1 Tax=Enterobius vermicularis TaxID=51028 RepID=A0A3P6I687_ENTVE|nr:unnamed protein product [Enterobius vermicularis]